MTLFRKMTEKGKIILIVNRLIYLMITVIFTFLFPLPSTFWLELYKNVKFCGVS